MTKQVSSDEELSTILGAIPSDNLVILNFHTAWAAPCIQMNQLFEELSKIPTEPPTTFISIDAEEEENADSTEKYEVSAVPFFVFLKDNRVLGSLSGADPILLKSMVEKHTGATVALPAQQTTTANTNGNEANAEGEEEEVVEDITIRLGKLVNAAPVMLFMKGTPASPQCGFSRQLVSMLREHEVRYGFFNILADDEVRQGLKVYSDWPTYPQLYHMGNLIGGLDIVKEEFESDPDFLRTAALEG